MPNRTATLTAAAALAAMLLAFGGCAGVGAAAWYALDGLAPPWRLPAVPAPAPFPHPRPHPRPRAELWVVTSDDCPHCRRLEAELPKADLCGYELHEQRGRGPVENVRAVPTLALLRDGREADRREGYLSAAELTRWLKAHPCDAAAGAGGSVVGGRQHDGEELSCDLPGAEQFKNVGSKLDGAGMCVFTSIEMAARWQGLEQMRGFRDWCAAKYPGGGYPGKVDQLIKAFCAAKGVEVPAYAQYENQSPEQVLELCDRTRRMACVTYGYGPRYGGQTIHHMTCCPKFSGSYAVNLDNNFVGESQYEWMSKQEFVKRVRHASQGWVFVWLDGSPPPAPFNTE